MVVGLFLDGWAHDNNQLETFFTPWHGVLYSALIAALLGIALSPPATTPFELDTRVPS